MLKRAYLDRIYGSKKFSNLQDEKLKSIPQLICPHCKQCIGVPFNYAKEDRPAYRMFVGALFKKVANSEKIKFTA